MPPDPPHRARERFTKLSVTVRMLRDFCFPHGWQRNRDWPAIRRALWKARDYVIPNGRGGWWLPFLLAEDRRRLALGDGDGHPGTTLGDLVMVAIDLPNRGFGRPTNPQSIDLFATSTPTPTGGGGEEIVGAPLERARPTPSLPGQKGSELSQVQSGVRAQGALRRPLWRSGAAPYRGCDGSDEGVRSRPT